MDVVGAVVISMIPIVGIGLRSKTPDEVYFDAYNRHNKVYDVWDVPYADAKSGRERLVVLTLSGRRHCVCWASGR